MWVGSGGEQELGARLLGVVVEDVDELAHGDVGEVATFAVGPFLVLLLQDSADQARHAVTVGEDLDDVSAAFDLSCATLVTTLAGEGVEDVLCVGRDGWRDRDGLGAGVDHG